MKYRLKDNQIEGRYYGVDVIFDSKQEIEDTLKEALMDDDIDVSLIPLWELLEMADYEIEEMDDNVYREELIIFLENELELLYHENEDTYSTDNCIDSMQEYILGKKGGGSE